MKSNQEMSVPMLIECLAWNCKDNDIAIAALKELIAKSPVSIMLVMQTPFRKELWENEAKVIASQDDDVIKVYLVPLLNWIADLNWPGSEIIFDRIVALGGKETIRVVEKVCCFAQHRGEISWSKHLTLLRACIERRVFLRDANFLE